MFALASSRVASADPAAAEALYRDGNQLSKDGKLDDACLKWAASLKEDESAGVAFLVAQCDAKRGKTASAWAGFVLAERLAKRQNRKKDADDAAKRAKDLEPKLTFLAIEVATPRTDLKVERDGEVVSAAALGTKIPVDPGEHVVRASAPGAESWTSRVTTKDGDGTVTIKVPALATATTAPIPSAGVAKSAAPAASHAAPSATPAASKASSISLAPAPTPTAGYALIGVGALAAGATVFFGMRALSSYKDAKDACPTRQDCSPAAISARDDAGTRAKIADVTGAISLVAIGVGGYLVLRTPNASEARSRIEMKPTLGLGPSQINIGVGGSL